MANLALFNEVSNRADGFFIRHVWIGATRWIEVNNFHAQALQGVRGKILYRLRAAIDAENAPVGENIAPHFTLRNA